MKYLLALVAALFVSVGVAEAQYRPFRGPSYPYSYGPYGNYGVVAPYNLVGGYNHFYNNYNYLGTVYPTPTYVLPYYGPYYGVNYYNYNYRYRFGFSFGYGY